jgi:hypothetical protein
VNYGIEQGQDDTAFYESQVQSHVRRQLVFFKIADESFGLFLLWLDFFAQRNLFLFDPNIAATTYLTIKGTGRRPISILYCLLVF